MIPDFDKDGNLQPGIHFATLEEVVERFNGKNLRRQQLTNSLTDFYTFICEHSDEIYLVGSYTSQKPAPKDIDFFVILRKSFDWTGQDGMTLLYYQSTPNFRLHILTCRYNQRGLRRKRLLLFAKTKDDPPLKRGFIRLEG